MPPPPPPSGFKAFTYNPALSAFNAPLNAVLPTRVLDKLPTVPIKCMATGAVVFSADHKEVLLVQRAPHDSMPLRWEIPGGACDEEDETLLHGLARELWEESGLVLKHVFGLVSEDTFFTRSGRLVEKLSFVTEVETEAISNRPDVTLDPQEHVAFLWATEEECKNEQVGEVKVQFTTKDQKRVILDAFKLVVQQEASPP
ncbi:putative nudix hydrolase [Podospora australis]|uniref:Nudix hydrolase n=1 Tax=Podospora australis TaxID=1536484 RepID=A0AAN6WS95_9PEZI|nr:putative nudix hydrolase [Podospora australis]